MNINQKHIGTGALQSFWSKVCIFAFFEHFRALPEHLWKQWEIVQKSIFWVHFFIRCTDSLRHRCSWNARRWSRNARRCSKVSKIQNIGPGLSNALFPKIFGQKTTEIWNFENKPFSPLWFRKSGVCLKLNDFAQFSPGEAITDI